MEKNRPNIDQLIQSSLDSFEPQLPNGIWNNIEDKLDQKDAAKRKKVITWSSVAAVVFIGLSGMFYSNMPDKATVDHKTEIEISKTESQSGSFDNKVSQSSPKGNDLAVLGNNKDIVTSEKTSLAGNNHNKIDFALSYKNNAAPNLLDMNQQPKLTQEKFEYTGETNFDFLNSKELGLINIKIL